MSILTKLEHGTSSTDIRVGLLERQVDSLRGDMKIVQELIKQNNAVLQEIMDAIKVERV